MNNDAASKIPPYTGPGFACMECGKKFRTVKTAERAQSQGCPQCGGCDIDLEVGR